MDATTHQNIVKVVKEMQAVEKLLKPIVEQYDTTGKADPDDIAEAIVHTFTLEQTMLEVSDFWPVLFGDDGFDALVDEQLEKFDINYDTIVRLEYTLPHINDCAGDKFVVELLRNLVISFRDISDRIDKTQLQS